MSDPLQAILTELHAAFATLYGERLADMRLYGSQARGDATPESDIDVLVVLAGTVVPGEEIARTAPIVAELSLRHDVVIACVFVSEHRFREEHSAFLRNVRREGIPL